MPRRRLDDLVDRLGAGTMAGRARQPALRGPSSVAVHDDSYVHNVLCTTELRDEKKSRAAGCFDHRLDMIEISIQGVSAQRRQPVDRPRAPLFE